MHFVMAEENNSTKNTWLAEDDKIVCEAISHGESKWSEIAKLLPGNRTGKQCRERWYNHLDPNLTKSPWNDSEDNLLIELQANLGNCWAKISHMIPGRSENEVKNRWYSAVIRKKLKHIQPQVTFMKSETVTRSNNEHSALNMLSNDELVSVRVAEVYLRSVLQAQHLTGFTSTDCISSHPITNDTSLSSGATSTMMQNLDNDQGSNALSQQDFREVCARLEDCLVPNSSSTSTADTTAIPSSFRSQQSCSYLMLEPVTMSGLTTPWYGLSACASPSWLGEDSAAVTAVSTDISGGITSCSGGNVVLQRQDTVSSHGDNDMKKY